MNQVNCNREQEEEKEKEAKNRGLKEKLAASNDVIALC
jgi:hypothetical protein